MPERLLRLVVLLLTVQVSIAGETYIPPNLEALKPKTQQSLLALEERTALSTQLGRFVKSLPPKTRLNLAAQYLAVAMCLDPANKTAVDVNNILSRKGSIRSHEKVDGKALGNKLARVAVMYLESSNPFHKQFAGYLFHLAILAAPSELNIAFQYEVYRQGIGEVNWSSVLGPGWKPGKELVPPKVKELVSTRLKELALSTKEEKVPGAPAQSLKKATVNGLAVTFIKGEMVGVPLTVHMTAGHDSKVTGIVGKFEQSEIGQDMKDSLKNATHVLHERNKDRSGMQMTITFNSTVPKSGPSAGVAFTLAGIELLEGIKINPEAAVTGGVNQDGTVHTVGGITAKIWSATQKGMSRVAVPTEDERDLYDLLIQKSYKDMLYIHVYTISTIDEALETLRGDQKPERVEGELLFQKVKTHLLKKGKRGLTEKVYRALVEIQQKLPNSFSTRLLIEMYKKKLPHRNYSARMSVTEINKHLYFFNDPKNNITNISKQKVQEARKVMHELKPLLASEVQKLFQCSEDILRSLESGIALHRRGVTHNHQGFRTLVDHTVPRQLEAYQKEIKRLSHNDEFLKKWME